MTKKERFSSLLREYRAKTGLTQQQVVDALELKNRRTVGNWETGLSEPSIENFLKLCKLYQVYDVYSFLEDDEQKSCTPGRTFTEREVLLIEHYNSLDDFKKAVDKLLDM